MIFVHSLKKIHHFAQPIPPSATPDGTSQTVKVLCLLYNIAIFLQNSSEILKIWVAKMKKKAII
jgi:hypothetical protein